MFTILALVVIAWVLAPRRLGSESLVALALVTAATGTLLATGHLG